MHSVLQGVSARNEPPHGLPRIPLKHRDFKDPIGLIYDNVLYSMTSTAMSMFNFLVCAGAPGIGDYFSSCYSTNLTI